MGTMYHTLSYMADLGVQKLGPQLLGSEERSGSLFLSMYSFIFICDV